MAISYIPTRTLEGDGFASLFEAYKGAFPAGTSLTSFTQQVVKANGVPYSAAAIDNWVFSVSGKRLPLVTSGSPPNNPGSYGGAKGVGWAFFGDGNVIQLPDFPRPGVSPTVPAPGVTPTLIVRDSKAMLWVVAAGLAMFLLAGGSRKKKT